MDIFFPIYCWLVGCGHYLLVVCGGSVSSVAVFSQSDTSVGVPGLEFGLSSLERGHQVTSDLGLISRSEDLVDNLDDWDVPLELVELSGLAGDELLALLGFNLELLEGRLQLAHLGGQV